MEMEMEITLKRSEWLLLNVHYVDNAFFFIFFKFKRNWHTKWSKCPKRFIYLYRIFVRWLIYFENGKMTGLVAKRIFKCIFAFYFYLQLIWLKGEKFVITYQCLLFFLLMFFSLILYLYCFFIVRLKNKFTCEFFFSHQSSSTQRYY